MTTIADEARVRELETRLFKAFIDGDATALDRLLADDFAFSDPAGPVVGKEEWLRDVSTGDLAFTSMEGHELEMKNLGDTIIVLGSATLAGRYSKSDYNGDFRYIDVYARRDGDWKLVLISAERRRIMEG